MRRSRYYYDSDDDINMGKCMLCMNVLYYYDSEICICKICYEKILIKHNREITDYKKILNQHNREIADLKTKVAFLRFWSSPNDDDAHHDSTSPAFLFPDVMLVTSCSNDSSSSPPDPILAHKAILANRSPVFKAMLENEMEESKTGIIKITDASNDAVRALVNFMYTAEALLDEKMGCALLELAEKYMVKHLKEYCEKFLSSQLDWENSLKRYVFAHQQNAKQLLQSALALILDNMDKLTQREEYKELEEKDPRLLVGIYEAHLSKFL
ncbi:hypothetical protein CRYUN_Cryun27aG0039600 [Craigia yunnanensis]